MGNMKKLGVYMDNNKYLFWLMIATLVCISILSVLMYNFVQVLVAGF